MDEQLKLAWALLTNAPTVSVSLVGAIVFGVWIVVYFLFRRQLTLLNTEISAREQLRALTEERFQDADQANTKLQDAVNDLTRKIALLQETAREAIKSDVDRLRLFAHDLQTANSAISSSLPFTPDLLSGDLGPFKPARKPSFEVTNGSG